MPPPPPIPFPTSTTATHPLLVIDYTSLVSQPPSADSPESLKLFEASTTLGFFYLKLEPETIDFQGLMHVGERVFDQLEEEEKKKYDVGLTGTSFGYKAIGHDNVNENGEVDTNEQFNISRDDMLSYPEKTHMDYPKLIIESVKTLQAFTTNAREISMTILRHLEYHLQLPAGTFQDVHKEGPGLASPTKARVIRNPPQHESTKLALGAHTDFGSLTLLDNNMTGGLQVLAPGREKWEFVQPLQGHAICNLADSLVILSGGILRSNLHRVLPPPGEQRACTRWSGIHFLVPEFDTILEPFASLSPLIAAAAKDPKMEMPAPGTTCRQWFERRLKGVRAGNRTGPESWLGSRGTEYVVVEGLSAKAIKKREEGEERQRQKGVRT